MKITLDEVRYVADLANLNLNEDEVRKFQADLDEILVHFDRLNEADVSQCDAMAQVLYEAEETATLRDDVERPPIGQDAALANAPVKGAGFFKVTKVIER